MIVLIILAVIITYILCGSLIFYINAQLDVTTRYYEAPAVILLWPLIALVLAAEAFGRWATRYDK